MNKKVIDSKIELLIKAVTIMDISITRLEQRLIELTEKIRRIPL